MQINSIRNQNICKVVVQASIKAAGTGTTTGKVRRGHSRYLSWGQTTERRLEAAAVVVAKPRRDCSDVIGLVGTIGCPEQSIKRTEPNPGDETATGSVGALRAIQRSTMAAMRPAQEGNSVRTYSSGCENATKPGPALHVISLPGPRETAPSLPLQQ